MLALVVSSSTGFFYLFDTDSFFLVCVGMFSLFVTSPFYPKVRISLLRTALPFISARYKYG